MTWKRPKRIRPRNPYIELMRLHTKPGPHKNRKKEANRLKCREFRRRRGDIGEE